MPDILLIQPPISDFYLTAKRTIPYGLACIASTLAASGFTVEILDALATSKTRDRELPQEMTYLQEFYGRPDRSPFALFHRYRHFGYGFDYLGRKARESGAFLVGISSLFTAYSQEALQTAEAVKAHHPTCKIVMGGHHPTAIPQAVMESAAVDFVIRGEGEAAMPLLAGAIREKQDYESIPGLVFRRTDGSLHINSAAWMQDPDTYPLPAAELINRRFYRRRNGGSMVVVAGRGCPMACSYCSVGARSGPAFRQRNVDSIMREIAVAVEQCGAGFIDFEDENLSLNRGWFLKLLQAIKSRYGGRLELRAMNGLYPPSLDEEIIRAMKSAGFKTLNLSVGSTSKEQLLRFNRADVRGAFNRALDIAESCGLNAVGYIICAAPFQNAQGSISDLLYLACRRVLVGASVFYPSPGSRDYDLCADLKLLPKQFGCMRSSTFPLSHTTSRPEAVTLLRLARIVNFMKYLLDQGIPLPSASSEEIRTVDARDRIGAGLQLLAGFLADGRIRGVTPDGQVFEHAADPGLCREFIKGLAAIELRGSL
jgi:anaerobic magnesium-protoporphyrin IX monomethyl ester cyclase